MNSSRRKFFSKMLFFFILVAGLAFAAEQEASDNALDVIVKFKDQGFVNVKGERRGYLEAKKMLTQNIRMFDGQAYLALVAGDKDIQEIYLVIKDPNGKTVAKAKGGSDGASLVYTPEAKDKYTFYIQSPKSGGYYHFSLVTQ